MKKVVIIGGGLTGAFAGYFLAQLGVQVVLIDPGQEKGRASHNNPGGINPLHGPGIPGVMSDFALQCHGMHLAEWPAIVDISGIDFSGRTVTRLLPALEEDDLPALRDAAVLYREAPGFSAQWMDGGDLRKLDDRISEDVLGGLATTGNATVDSTKYVRAVQEATRKLGGELIAGQATGLEVGAGRVTAVVAGNLRFPCSDVLVATGPWLDLVEKHFGIVMPAAPARGQLLLAELGPDAPGHDITWRQYGVYHSRDGLFWLGGTRKDGGFDDSPSDEEEHDILTGVSRILPELNHSRILRRNVGLRPMTPDGLPIVGELPGCDNAYVASGGGQKGVLLSIGMARISADRIAGQTDHRNLSFLSPNRFPDASFTKQASI